MRPVSTYLAADQHLHIFFPHFEHSAVYDPIFSYSSNRPTQEIKENPTSSIGAIIAVIIVSIIVLTIVIIAVIHRKKWAPKAKRLVTRLISRSKSTSTTESDSNFK